MTAADLVICDLSSENLELRERIALLEWHRLAHKQAIELLHAQGRELEVARRRIAALVAENRRLRGDVRTAAA